MVPPALAKLRQASKTPGAPEVPLPTIDFDAWRDLAKAGGTIEGSYSIPPGNIGPVEITGSAVFSSNSNVTIKGPIYIHGSLSISGNGDWNLDDSLGADGTMII